MIAIEVKGGGQAHSYIHSIREILLVTQYLMNILYSLYFGCGGSVQIINRECGNAPFRKAVNSSLMAESLPQVRIEVST